VLLAGPSALALAVFALLLLRALEQEAPSAVPHAALLLALLGAALLLIAAVFILVLTAYARRLSRTLEAVSEAMRGLETGDPTPVTPEEPDDEAGRLARSFNRTADRFAQSIERMRLASRKRDLETQALINTLQPRFLYTALENIAWKANQEGHPDIGVIAAKLGRLLRLMRAQNGSLISLESLLRRTVLYIELQKSRYKGRLRVRLEASPEASGSLQSLPLLLLPCIENAILHAMRPRGVPLTIGISVARQEATLVFEISDDGLGMTEERLAEIRTLLSGPAPPRASSLKNLHDRLLLSFGPDYGLSIASTENTGTRITIRTPFCDAPRSIGTHSIR
jgi:two-component system sensor histidine kinase YesM